MPAKKKPDDRCKKARTGPTVKFDADRLSEYVEDAKNAHPDGEAIINQVITLLKDLPTLNALAQGTCAGGFAYIYCYV